MLSVTRVTPSSITAGLVTEIAARRAWRGLLGQSRQAQSLQPGAERRLHERAATRVFAEPKVWLSAEELMGRLRRLIHSPERDENRNQRPEVEPDRLVPLDGAADPLQGLLVVSADIVRLGQQPFVPVQALVERRQAHCHLSMSNGRLAVPDVAARGAAHRPRHRRARTGLYRAVEQVNRAAVVAPEIGVLMAADRQHLRILTVQLQRDVGVADRGV